jgi:hypothetical protein
MNLKVTCPVCEFHELIRVDIEDFPEEEIRKFAEKLWQENKDWFR